MNRRPWYAPDPPSFPPGEEPGWSIHGLWISRSTITPTGELPAIYDRRIRHLLEEYVAICGLAGEQFPIIRGYTITGHRTHRRGFALDIAPVGDWTPARMAVYGQIRWRQPKSRLRAIWIRPASVHLDIMPREKRVLGKARNHGKRLGTPRPY